MLRQNMSLHEFYEAFMSTPTMNMSAGALPVYMSRPCNISLRGSLKKSGEGQGARRAQGCMPSPRVVRKAIGVLRLRPWALATSCFSNTKILIILFDSNKTVFDIICLIEGWINGS